MYGFAGPVAALPVHHSSAAGPRGPPQGGAVAPPLGLGFHTVGSRPFRQSGRLRGLAGHPGQPGAPRALPRVVRHKPSSIVFSDSTESIPPGDAVQPSCRLFTSKGWDGELSSGQGGDDDDDGDDRVSAELLRRFFISHKRRRARKGRTLTRGSKREQEASGAALTSEGPPQAKQDGLSGSAGETLGRYCTLRCQRTLSPHRSLLASQTDRHFLDGHAGLLPA
ncbi:hypothetical protein P4O66_005608 [Electrophorus voltai]|uniref:Uncharacterized protein n=1 Tax=Electrophorus voltai TaxID=2609070 RepID=A0AAD8ZKM8_9TELE|nr:hypothetical protein P4O66_005608 [Electrophorus voltai]